MTDKELAEKMKGAIRFVGTDRKQSGGWREAVLEAPVTQLVALAKEYAQSDAPTEDLDLCPNAANRVHQYFEINKLSKREFNHKRDAYEARKEGILVKCALCKQSQELWEE